MLKRFGCESTNSTPEVRQTIQSFGGTENRSRVREGRLLGAHQRLVAIDAPFLRVHDGLKCEPHGGKRALKTCLQARPVPREHAVLGSGQSEGIALHLR